VGGWEGKAIYLYTLQCVGWWFNDVRSNHLCCAVRGMWEMFDFDFNFDFNFDFSSSSAQGRQKDCSRCAMICSGEIGNAAQPKR